MLNFVSTKSLEDQLYCLVYRTSPFSRHGIAAVRSASAPVLPKAVTVVESADKNDRMSSIGNVEVEWTVWRRSLRLVDDDITVVEVVRGLNNLGGCRVIGIQPDIDVLPVAFMVAEPIIEWIEEPILDYV